MKGKLIVLEGLDGSGKATQTKFLFDRCCQKRIPVTKVSFPNYDSNSSALVKMYLRGQMGKLDEVNAYAASTFYSVDRYATYNSLYKDQHEQGTHIISDRYTTSNIVHQAPKLPAEERSGYIQWLEDLEYTKMGLPRPDMVIYLDMDPGVSRHLLDKRYMGSTDKLDIHEADFEYLMHCRNAALKAAEYCGWVVISCCDENGLLGTDQISDMIWDKVKTLFESTE